MLNENAQKLVNALRSGEYKQGQRYLTQIVYKDSVLKEQEELNCCLEIACKLYQKEHPELKSVEVALGSAIIGYQTNKEINPETRVLPRVVQRWLGFSYYNGEYDSHKSLATLNDDGKSFCRNCRYN